MRTIEIVDEQLHTDIGTLLIFDNAHKAPTYRFLSSHPDYSDTPISTSLPSFLDDALPDSWGQRLIKRNLSSSPQVHPHDFLLEVSDHLRTGSLRFFERGEALAPFHNIPPIIDLPVINTEVHKVLESPDYRVSELIGIGSQSLGGARPKATVIDKDGSLWIAKFATERDKPSLEARIMQAASQCGINAAQTRSVAVANSSAVLSKRFDRSSYNPTERIGMRSYAAVLNIMDAGVDADWGDIASYTDPRDYSELWKRTLFGLLVHNTDDHIRNHSQIRLQDSRAQENHTGEEQWTWRLSPAYDITHNEYINTPHALGLLGENEAEKMAPLLKEFGLMLSIPEKEQAGFLLQIQKVLEEKKLLFRRDLIDLLTYR